MNDPFPFEFNPDISRQYYVSECAKINSTYASTLPVSWQDSRTNDEIILADIPANSHNHRATWFVTFAANDKKDLTLHFRLPLKLGASSKGI